MRDLKASTEAAIEIQRRYYAETAERYDNIHGNSNVEHNFALQFMISACRYLGIRSILDVGSGTGRALLEVKSAIQDISVVGVEPSHDLRKVGHSKGLGDTELVDGDAMKLNYQDGSFDLVCEFGALHHIPVPSEAVAEMLRVARTAIFISDCNNFGQGSRLSRLVKQMINAAGLWSLLYRVRTKGKGYTISANDGLAYSYSVFNDFAQIEKSCASVHMLNPLAAGPNLYRTASHVALLGLKFPS
ncbi:MAG TPA: class I SAM-dependent methyltransferase [Terracidiphilus sp.]|nr:class I SAM-dependent methyltransferase [Terracidiphilus sp.]